MSQLMLGFGRRYTTAREALLGLLSDLGWHSHKALAAAAGVRYGARVRELRRLGYVIETRDIEHGNEYRLTSTERSEPAPKRVKIFMDEQDAHSVSVGLPNARARIAVNEALGSFRANREKL